MILTCRKLETGETHKAIRYEENGHGKYLLDRLTGAFLVVDIDSEGNHYLEWPDHHEEVYHGFYVVMIERDGAGVEFDIVPPESFEHDYKVVVRDFVEV